MNLPSPQPFNRTLRIGLLFMAVASAAKMLLEGHSVMPEGPRDGAIGLLFGLAIGCMLLGLWRMKHPGAAADKGRCA